MPTKPLRPCRKPGCTVLVADGYCARHRPKEAARSEESKQWRWMYGTDTWKQLRAEQMLNEPFCRACAKRGVRRRATDVDHIRDHKGDWAKFTDTNNLESLCHSCHSRKTALEMRDFFRKKAARKQG